MNFLFMKNKFSLKEIKQFLGAASLKALGEFKIPKKTLKPVVELILEKPHLFDNFIKNKMSLREYKTLFQDKEDCDEFITIIAEELMIHLSENWLKYELKVIHYTELNNRKDLIIEKRMKAKEYPDEYAKFINQMLSILEGTFNRWIECQLEISVVGCNILTYELLSEQFIEQCFVNLEDKVERLGSIEKVRSELNQLVLDFKKVNNGSYWK